jgi:hypothetical protein
MADVISIPSVPLSTTDLIVCGLAILTAAALAYLVRLMLIEARLPRRLRKRLRQCGWGRS